jgi:hypothetical protein
MSPKLPSVNSIFLGTYSLTATLKMCPYRDSALERAAQWSPDMTSRRTKAWNLSDYFGKFGQRSFSDLNGIIKLVDH